MRRQQKADGSFASGWDDPVIDTAEAIVTLKLLGIDPATWRSSTGKSPVDYLATGALNPDGSFGTSKNAMDATWVLWACNSLGVRPKVIWYYSKSVDQQPPTWEELVGRQSGGNQESSGSPQAPVPPPILPVAGGEAQTFADVAGHWAQKEIEFLTVKGYVYGFGGARFAPDAVITRAEFAALLARLAGFSEQPDGADRFADVPAGAWYRGMVGAAARAGLVYGVNERRFAPDAPVTREQVAAMVARLMVRKGLDTTIGEAEAAEVLAGFSDAAGLSFWARSAVALVAREGVMRGRTAAQFAPFGRATRAEAAVVLCRVWQQMPPAAR